MISVTFCPGYREIGVECSVMFIQILHHSHGSGFSRGNAMSRNGRGGILSGTLQWKDLWIWHPMPSHYFLPTFHPAKMFLWDKGLRRGSAAAAGDVVLKLREAAKTNGDGGTVLQLPDGPFPHIPKQQGYRATVPILTNWAKNQSSRVVLSSTGRDTPMTMVTIVPQRGSTKTTTIG